MTSQSKMHTVGSRVWLKDTEEGWIKGEVLKLHEDDAVIVKMENGDEKVFREEEIPLQNPGVRGVEVSEIALHRCTLVVGVDMVPWLIEL